ncbi:MAG: sensor protein [Sphingobacteriales bacterium]|nr:sensor protein [Sphingobacteriales bacterium]
MRIFSSYKFPLIYFVICIVWEITTDYLLQLITDGMPEETSILYYNWNGYIFLIITGIIFYLRLKKEYTKQGKLDKQYRYLFSRNPNPMFIAKLQNQRIIEVNDAALESYGYTRKEFLNLSLSEIHSTANTTNVDSVLKTVKNKKMVSSRFLHRKKSGKDFSVSIISHKIDFNDQPCSIVLAIDINEQVTNEQKLSEAYNIERKLNLTIEKNEQIIEDSNEVNRRFGEVLTKINNMVLVSDANGVITWANTSFEKFTGYTAEESIGRSAIELLTGSKTNRETVESFFRTAVQPGDVFSEELINYTKDGKENWIEVNISPIYANGKLEGFISVISVITERKKQEEKIRALNEALRKIAWSSSHELRKPVASIISLINLAKGMTTEMELKEYLELLELSSNELDEISRRISTAINHVENKYM